MGGEKWGEDIMFLTENNLIKGLANIKIKSIKLYKKKEYYR